MNETNNETYFYVFALRSGGLVESPYTEEDTRQMIEDSLVQLYGSKEVFDILEFRKATEEEIAASIPATEEAPAIH